MDLGLQGKVALVTGGSRGIGRASAVALSREGAEVVISYASNEDAARATVEEIQKAGGKASAERFDVADAAAASAAVDAIVESKGGLHVLVSNAGVSIDGLLLRFKDEDFEKVFRTNVFGAFYLMKAAARPMMKARWGRVILIGSVVGESGNAGQIPYAGSKAALDGMARSLARELATRNITANVVAPGFVDTDMTRALPDAVQKSIVGQVPLGRVATAEEIADTVAFIASERARYITGQVINVNGGMHM